MNSSESRDADELLRQLEQAGEKGLTKAQLFVGSARTQTERSLADLLARHKVANLGTPKKPRFVSVKFCDPLELARLAILAKATPGIPTLFSKKELAEGCAGGSAKKLDEAIAALVNEKKLLRLQHGKSVLHLHAASIEPLLHPAKKTPRRAPASRQAKQAPLPKPLPPRAPEFPADAVRAAYRELARESGFSDVLISDLQQRSGASLDALKPWLLQESRAGRVLPTRGDWSITDAVGRAAAIEIGGEPHLRVRFVEPG